MQFSTFHIFISLLNAVVNGEFSIPVGTLFPRMLPLNANQPVPQVVILTVGVILYFRVSSTKESKGRPPIEEQRCCQLAASR